MVSDSESSSSDKREAHQPYAPTNAIGRKISAEDTRAQIQKIQTLPLLPLTRALLSAQAGFNTQFVHAPAIIARDPAIAAKALSLAYPDELRSGQASCSIEKACDWLGFHKSSNLLLNALSEAPTTESPDSSLWKTFQERSILAGTAARCIAQVTGYAFPDDLYAAALLHDIGRLALATVYGQDYVQVSGTLPTAERLVSERENFGLSTPEAGLILAQAWDLPPLIAHTIRLRISPNSAKLDKPAAAVGLAVVLAGVFGSKDKEECKQAAAMCRQYLKILGIPPNRLVEINEKVRFAFEAGKANNNQLRETTVVQGDLPEAASTSSGDAAPSPVATPKIVARDNDVPSQPPPLQTPENSATVIVGQESTPWSRGELRVRPSNLAQQASGNANQADSADSQLRTARRASPSDNDTALPSGTSALIKKLRGPLPLLVISIVCIALFWIVLRSFSAGENAKTANATDPRNPLLPAFGDAKPMTVADAMIYVNTKPISPETAGYLSKLGDYYYANLKNYAEAVKYYQRLVDDFSAWEGTKYACVNLADCYTRLGMLDSAAPLYRRIIREFPENSPEYDLARTKLEAAQ